MTSLLTVREAADLLRLSDAAVYALCKANQLPIVVFNINQPGAITRVLRGERVGTVVR